MRAKRAIFFSGVLEGYGDGIGEFTGDARNFKCILEGYGDGNGENTGDGDVMRAKRVKKNQVF